MSNVILTLNNISKSFDGTSVLENFHLEIKEHEFVTLLGPSGCGKTTTLRIIGGFENPDSGDVFFEGKSISKLPPNKRPFNTVFQKYSLFSHMNIYENVAFGLKIKKMKKELIEQKVSEALKMVNLEGFEKRMPDSLSGGQQQRIAIARAIVNEPRVLLFDEPLGALDLKLRQEMQFELKNLQRKLGITFLYVTHDQEEALTMSDTVVVMSEGVIQQSGSPVDIYNEPKNAFVASFIGESNIISGVMAEDFKVQFAGREFACVDKGFAKNEPVDVVIRPEDIHIVPYGQGMLDVCVTSVVFKGVHYEMLLEGENFTWLVQSTKAQQEGEKLSINIFEDEIHIMHKLQKEQKDEKNN